MRDLAETGVALDGNRGGLVGGEGRWSEVIGQRTADSVPVNSQAPIRLALRFCWPTFFYIGSSKKFLGFPLTPGRILAFS